MGSALALVALVLCVLLFLRLQAQGRTLARVSEAVTATNRRLAAYETAQRLAVAAVALDTQETIQRTPSPAAVSPVRSELPVTVPRAVLVTEAVSEPIAVAEPVTVAEPIAAAKVLELAWPPPVRTKTLTGIAGIAALSNTRRDPETRDTVEMLPPRAEGDGVDPEGWDGPEEKTKVFTAAAPAAPRPALRPPPPPEEPEADEAIERPSILPEARPS